MSFPRISAGGGSFATLTGVPGDNAALAAALAAKLNLTGGTLTGPLTITGGAVTNSTPLLVMSQTWNDGTDVFKFDTKAVTNTASKAYSSTWADVSTVNEILVDGTAKFAFIPKGSENFPMLALGSENNVLLKAAAYAFIVRSEATYDMVALGWCNSAPGVTVAQNGRIGFNQSGSFLSGGNAEPTAFFKSPGDAIIQMGSDHATTPTHQTFKAHDVTTGVGADMYIKGGSGDSGDGYVRLGTAAGGISFFDAAGTLKSAGNTNSYIIFTGSGSALLDDSQSDGGAGGGSYTFGGLIATLKAYGLIG